MAVTTSIKSLSAKVDWDEAWATRPGSGSGFRWKIVTSSGGIADGVIIDNPTAKDTFASFANSGSYKAIFGVSDGAMAVSATSDVFTVQSGIIEIPIPATGTITVPVETTIPTGDVGVYQKLDCVLDIDTTGSMGGTIVTATTECANIISALYSGGRDVYCALNDHRDVGDAWVSKVVVGLTPSLSSMKAGLATMAASGGGDSPEAQLFAIYDVCRSLAWRDGSLRVYVQFSDAPAWDPRNGVSSAMALEELKNRKCTFIGINCGSASYMSNMASATGGQVFALGSSASGVVSAIESALTAMSNNLTVELVADSDAPAGLIKSIVPYSCTIGSISGNYFIGQRPGTKFVFKVTFGREGMIGSGVRTYTFKLLIREASSSAIIDEVPVKVSVNFDATD